MTRKLILIVICTFCFTAIFAQNKVLDKPWIKENTPTRRVVPYTHVREADVMWHRRIWRVIDLREKINQPLYYPIQKIQDRKSLFDVLKEGVLEGTITAYSDADDEFTVQLTKAEAKNRMGFWKETKQYDDFGEEIFGAADSTYEEYESIDVVEYRIKEDWFFDRERSIMDVRIIGIAPALNIIDQSTGESKGKQLMFWVYFPEARYVFANYDVYNRQNDAENRTFDDIFWKRMFNSYIVKRSNVYDRNNKDYLKGLDLILESDNIKEDMFNLEHDMWHF
ncbi:MAG: gliding motility protein GldN [Flavobacteriales bacterium]|nr:gliding motility protein GldN [Flavobacteriales bacterium]MCB9174708.1 gliding motility protein GldN [Flavobacteriales bacterium]